jgi:hypothetical protein
MMITITAAIGVNIVALENFKNEVLTLLAACPNGLVLGKGLNSNAECCLNPDCCTELPPLLLPPLPLPPPIRTP